MKKAVKKAELLLMPAARSKSKSKLRVTQDQESMCLNVHGLPFIKKPARGCYAFNKEDEARVVVSRKHMRIITNKGSVDIPWDEIVLTLLKTYKET